MPDIASIYEALNELDRQQGAADAAHRVALSDARKSGSGKEFLKTLRAYVKANNARNKKLLKLLEQLEKAEKKASESEKRAKESKKGKPKSR